MRRENLFKFIALLSITLLFFACNKEMNSIQEIQDKEFINHSDDSFVSVTKATDIAATFFGQLTNDPLTKSYDRDTSTETVRDGKNDNAPMMYVINYYGGGFVVVSATKDYYPILAYSDENDFVLSDDMGGVAVWMEETKEAIRQSGSLDEATKAEIHRLWQQYETNANMISSTVVTKSLTPEQDLARENRIAELNQLGFTVYSLSSAYANGLISLNNYQGWWGIGDLFGTPDHTIVAIGVRSESSQVGPFLQTAWDQVYPYNSQVPLKNGQRPYLGCTTIAIAQIMSYHTWPSDLDWDTMIQQGGSSTVTQNFLYNLAVDMNADFGNGDDSLSTSIPASAAIAALQLSKYGYSSSMSLVTHNSSTVRTQLDSERPVWMEGTDPNDETAAHAWVCDGYIAETNEDIYFVEFLMGGPGSYYYASKNEWDYVPSFQSPWSTGGVISYYYDMNWGCGGDFNGWFYSDNVNVYELGYNFSNYRLDIINIKKQ